MTFTFYLFQGIYFFVFAQSKLLQRGGDQINPRQLRVMSISTILGWIVYTGLFIYFGIYYSWLYTILGFIVTSFLTGIGITVFPILLLVSRLWPILFLSLIYLEFLK